MLKNKEEKARFIVVGGANTVIDFGLLFLLKTLGLPTITANIISTTSAFCFSFFANKKYTFKTTDTNVKREVILFVLVTLFGLWVLQTIVIKIVLAAIGVHLQGDLALLAAKLCATVVSLVWNYVLYSRVVFRTAEK
jgi:putative flippase GtrA